MIETFYISDRFFTKQELENFFNDFGYNINQIEYGSTAEIDFSEKAEKEFLLEKGYPKILARFFT